MEIDHIGYAVKRIERAAAAFEALGFSFEPEVEDRDRNIRLAFGRSGGYTVELVSPLDKALPSPVDAYLSKLGPTPYHLCYRTADLERELEGLQQQGYRVVIPPAPAVAFGGRRVVFLMHLQLGLLELVETA